MSGPAAPTRDRLIGAAIELVSGGGEEALTLRALGTHCGLSRGAAYRHFEDKDALVRAIAAAGMTEVTARMGRASAARGRDPLTAAMNAYSDWAIANPSWYRLTFQQRAATPASGVEDAALKDAARGLLELVTQLVVDAQRAGSLPDGDPGELVGILWATLHGAVDLALAGHAKPELHTDKPRHVMAGLMRLLQRA
ncbi:MAG: TetR/AcrR family transcriptional regulator [Acidimicrobiia bacterium]